MEMQKEELDVYNDADELLDADELTAEEEGFMRGYEGEEEF